MKLFVAIALPKFVTASLPKPAGSPGGGVALTSPDQMHLTVRFIGDANADAARRALEAVECKRIRVSLRGVGRFRLAGGRTILWAGVKETEELLGLHAQCGRVLAATGIKLERRRFIPHVTLARLKSTADESIVSAFLGAGDELSFGDFTAEQFALYSSVAREDGARYEVIASYPLI